MNMSDKQLGSSYPLAPRYRHDSPASDSIPTDGGSRPPVLIRLPDLDAAATLPERSTTAPLPGPRTPQPPEPNDRPLADSYPEETAPVETAPVETAPMETAPVEMDRQWDTEDEPDRGIPLQAESETPLASERGREERSEPKPSLQEPARSRLPARAAWSKRSEVDWRNPTYKLGGALLAALLVVIVLLALNRRHGEVPSASPANSPAEDSLVAVPPSIEMGPSDRQLTGRTDSEPATDLTAVETNHRPADSASSPPSAGMGQMLPPADSRPDEVGGGMAAAERPRQALGDGQVPDYRPPAQYTQAPRAAWSNIASSSSTAASPPSAGVPSRTGRSQAGAESASGQWPWPSQPQGERGGPGTEQWPPAQPGTPDQVASARSGEAYSRSEPRPTEEVAVHASYPSTPYPSTPYTAMFPDLGGSSNPGGQPAGVRTAERNAAGDGVPTPYQTDVNRAPARLQGRIEPFTTGSYEHYR